MKIFKYQLPNFVNTFKAPKNFKILHVDNQEDMPTIWAAVDTDSGELERKFYVIPTGGDIPEKTAYVGTSVGPFLVWHVFKSLE